MRIIRIVNVGIRKYWGGIMVVYTLVASRVWKWGVSVSRGVRVNTQVGKRSLLLGAMAQVLGARSLIIILILSGILLIK